MDNEVKQELLKIQVALSDVKRDLKRKTWETRWIAAFYLFLLIVSLAFTIYFTPDDVYKKENLDRQFMNFFLSTMQDASNT